MKICGECDNWRCDEPLHLTGHCIIVREIIPHGRMCDTCTKFKRRKIIMPDLRVIVDNLDEAEYFYGGQDFIITPEEFEALKQGKILNFGIYGDEYGITIRLSDDILNKLEK
jgi:hypothetical protein